MRIRPRDVREDQRGAQALAAVLGGAFASRVTLERLRAVALLNMQPRKASDQFRDASARGLDFHGNGNRKAVVFDQVQQRKFLAASRVQGLPEFALARRAFPAGNVYDLFRIVAHGVAERRLLRLLERMREFSIVERSLGGADSLKKLRARRRRLADDVQLLMAPVGRHLTAGGA